MSYEPILALLLCTAYYVVISKLFNFLVGKIWGGGQLPPVPTAMRYETTRNRRGSFHFANRDRCDPISHNTRFISRDCV